MAKKDWTYTEILTDIKNKKYAPIYFLMGDEDYYIDLISNYIIDHVLNESEKEFNLTIAYGGDSEVSTIINAAKRYPMMSEHQVVVLKEAQMMQGLDNLSFYLQKPLNSTILVVCYKHGCIDKRKKLAAEVEKTGILFESKKIKESQLPTFIGGYLKRKMVEIEPKASSMLAEFVGIDLSRLTSELDKLCLTLPKNRKCITPETIERNIGISKDFNNFELKNAVINKDIFKANQIIKYFAETPKTNPIQMTLAILFSFFSNLMLAYYSPVKTEQGIANWLDLKSSWGARDYLIAMRNFTGIKTMHIISYIRYADAKSKGIGKGNTHDEDILRELVFKILH